MSFLHPQLLWLLFVPAALLVAAFLPRRRASALAHPKIRRAQLKPAALVLRPASRAARPIAAVLALACLVVALARPQGRTISTPSVSEARDVLQRGDNIDRFMRSNRLGDRAERDWASLRNDLDRLAASTRTAWRWGNR